MLPGNVEWYESASRLRGKHNIYVLGRERVVLVEPVSTTKAIPGIAAEDALNVRHGHWLCWEQSLRAAGRELVAIVVTHYHEDHIEGVEDLAHALGVPLLGPRELSDEIVGWRVLDTPGHADEHVSFLDEINGTVVLGDADQPNGDGWPHEFLDTIRRLSALDPLLALPAHGKPYIRCFADSVRYRLLKERVR